MDSKKGTSDYRIENIENMLKWDLDKKIDHAKKRIIEFSDYVDGKIVIGFSGGKDSCVVQHITRSIFPDTKSVMSNTTNEYVEIMKFVKQNPNTEIVNPLMDFRETVKKYGFPLVSKKVARSINDLRNPTEKNQASRNLYLTGLRQDGEKSRGGYKLAKKWYPLIEAKFNVTSKCCDILKKEPLHRWQKENDFYFIDGTTVEEGGYRKMSWLKYGCNVLDSDKPHSRPISIFTEDDIWAYIRRFNVPYCDIYDDKVIDGIPVKGEKRTGCRGCHFGAQFEKEKDGLNRFERQALRTPKAYKKLMELENNGVSYYLALQLVGTKTGLEDTVVEKGLL